ncbi:MAG: penicillin-binding protein 2 [Pseudomonadota bacterium]
MKGHINNPRQERRLFIKRIIVALFIIAILSAALLLRLIYLQTEQHRHYATLSAQNAISFIPIPPRRGLIYDRNGRLLAKNIPVYNLVITPNQIHNMENTLQGLQKIIPLSNDEISTFKKQLYQHHRFDKVLLKTNLTEQQIAAFAVNRWKFSGVTIQEELIRHYPYGSAFAHVVGYTGRINDNDLKHINIDDYKGTHYIGKTGIERYYEKLLHGKIGYKRVEVNAAGKTLRTLGTIPAKGGDNIYLTIDAKLQLAVEKALKGYAGAAVVLQVNTGQVLAMASAPSFDPNLFVRGISSKDYNALLNDPMQPLYDRAVRGLYAAGSTIKPFIALGALDDGVITPNFTIDDKGIFKIPHNKHIYHDYAWKQGGRGIIDVTKAIMVSSDTFFYTVGYKMGIDKIDAILSQFIFGKKTGIDLPDELSGVLPSPAWKMKSYNTPWYLGDTVISAIGQGYTLVTPIEMALNTAMIATRGKHYKPYLLDAISDGSQKTYTKTQQLPSVQLKHQQPWDVVLNAMHKVISRYGTGWGFGEPKNYTAAGKTGTAQVISINFGENYSKVPKKQRPDSWIIIFAPYKNPEIAVAVVVEHAPGHSAKIARRITDYYFAHKKEILGENNKTVATAKIK